MVRALVLTAILNSICGAQGMTAGEVNVPLEVLDKCDPYLRELLNRPDDSNLLDELCERIDNSVNTHDIAALKKIPEPQKVVWDVWSAKALLDNGGVPYYLTGDYVDYAGRSRSFRRLGLGACADALDRACAVFPQQLVPDDVEVRKKAITTLPDEVVDAWDGLTDDYFCGDNQLVFVLGSFARKHVSDFVALPSRRTPKEYDELLLKRAPLLRPDATPTEVNAWLDAAGGGSHDEATERITSAWLGSGRRSTSAELAALAATGSARDIVELGLDDTSYDDAAAPLLLNFPKLRELTISRTLASDTTVDVLEQMPTLQVVWMNETRITYPRFLKFVQRKKLTEISYSRSE